MAKLLITADDGFTASVNGKKVGGLDVADGWQQPQTFDLLPFLETGENIITVTAPNRGSFAGLLAKIGLGFDGRKPEIIVTDATWQATRQASPSLNDWKAAAVIVPFGKGPRGLIGEFIPTPVPILRDTFDVADKPVAHARLYSTALGIYELHLNGRRVGDEQFAPGWTDYDKRSSPTLSGKRTRARCSARIC